MVLFADLELVADNFKQEKPKSKTGRATVVNFCGQERDTNLGLEYYALMV